MLSIIFTMIMKRRRNVKNTYNLDIILVSIVQIDEMLEFKYIAKVLTQELLQAHPKHIHQLSNLHTYVLWTWVRLSRPIPP